MFLRVNGTAEILWRHSRRLVAGIAKPRRLRFPSRPAGDEVVTDDEEAAMARDLDEQLTKYLTDAHSIEVQALAQLRTAPDIAGAPELARAFRSHLEETEGHERITRELLERRDADPSKVKDVVMQLGGKGF